MADMGALRRRRRPTHWQWLSWAFAAVLAFGQTAPEITSPKEALGFNIGDDYQLANYAQLDSYWHKLAAESDRMKLLDIGPTAENRRH